MIILSNTLFTLLAFACMEGVAWLAHRFLMHGPLWFLHEDHHTKGEQRFFERNDTFFVLFATPAIILMIVGLNAGMSLAYFWIGVGITLYGMAYFLIHDVFIHQRFRWLRNANSSYFRAIRRAHKMHHKHLTKEDGECFGMLWVPLKYYRDAATHVLNDCITSLPPQS